MPVTKVDALTRGTLAVAVVAIVCGAAVPRAAAYVPQSGGSVVKPNPHLPPLKLSAEQRGRIKAVIGDQDTDVSFALKNAKPSKSFQPQLGTKLPKGLKTQAFPPPLIYEMPLLQRYGYVKFKDQVLIVNPMDKKIVDIVPLTRT